MIDIMDASQAGFALRPGEEACINGFAAGSDPGQAPQSCLNSRCRQSASTRYAVTEHAGIQFSGIAVQICDSPRIFCGNQQATLSRNAREQLVHEGIFGASDERKWYAKGRLHVLRIEVSGVRGGKNNRCTHFFWRL